MKSIEIESIDGIFKVKESFNNKDEGYTELGGYTDGVHVFLVRLEGGRFKRGYLPNEWTINGAANTATDAIGTLQALRGIGVSLTPSIGNIDNVNASINTTGLASDQGQATTNETLNTMINILQGGIESRVNEFNQEANSQIATAGSTGSIRIVTQPDGTKYAEIVASTGEKGIIELT